METAALISLVGLLALTFWRPLRGVRRVVGVTHLLASGYGFLVLGVTVGYSFGLADETRLFYDMSPILAFATGWVGFAAGSRFEFRVLANVPLGAFDRALVPALVAAVVVGLAGAATLYLMDIPTRPLVAGALCLAAVAASAGPTLVAVVRTRRGGRARGTAETLRMIEFSAGIADGLVLVLALVAFTFFPGAGEDSSRVLLLALSMGGGGALGFALWLFLANDNSDDEVLLLGLGVLAMLAGLGGWLGVSSAAVAAVAAVVLANLPGGRAEVLVRAIRRVERPVVVIIMAMIGVSIAGEMTWHVAVLITALTALRLVAKRVAAGKPRVPLEGAPDLSTPRAWTLGLVPQGILGLVVALGYFHVWQDLGGRTVLAAVALAGLLNELVAPFLLLRVLREATTHDGGAR